MKPNLKNLYRLMYKARYFEETIAELWRDGYISGEMHLGIGEEGIVVGVVDHLQDGDALLLDHRSTPPFVVRGVDLVSILLELLGSKDGLCCGNGGHMHLFSKEYSAASSGIVGSSAPLALGFALSSQYLQNEKVAVAFFGEGAMNQGMLMESLNLAVSWNLPVIFVCKDNDWAITTPTHSVTGGDILKRARSFGMPAKEAVGYNVEEIWKSSAEMIERARMNGGPSFLLAHCSHREGHFLGDPILLLFHRLFDQLGLYIPSLPFAFLKSHGAKLTYRIKSLNNILAVLATSLTDHIFDQDPLKITRGQLDEDVCLKIEEEIKKEIDKAKKISMDRFKEEKNG